MYIVTGYVFTKTFHFVALKQNTSDVEHILMSSVVVGYVYCNIAYLIPFTISKIADNILIVLSAVIFAYILARVLRNKKISLYILDWLKIRDTGNLYLWDDLMDNDYPMRAIVHYEDIIYDGIIHIYENYSNEPHIALGSYIIKDKDEGILYDFTDDDTRIVILNTANATDIEIVYNKDSTECADIRDLCDYNKNYVKEIDK